MQDNPRVEKRDIYRLTKEQVVEAIVEYMRHKTGNDTHHVANVTLHFSVKPTHESGAFRTDLEGAELYFSL